MRNKITLLFLSLLFIFVGCGKTTGQSKNNQAKADSNQVKLTNKITTGDWDYVEIKKTILEVFPEAYPEFFEITFTDWEDKVYPSTASFCVPDKYFPVKLTEEILDKRAKLLTEKFNYIGCEAIKVGEASQYSYGEWEDKKVRRLTFYFGIGC